MSLDCGNKEGRKQKRIGKRGTVILEQLLIFLGHRIPIVLYFFVILNPVGPQIYLLLAFPSHSCSKSRIGDHRSGKYTMYLGR